MIEFLTSEAGIGVLGAGFGFIARHFAEQRKANHDMIMEAIRQRDDSMDRAAERTRDGGTWMRRALYFLMAIIFVSVIVAGFVGIPVVIEVVAQKGFLFWKHSVTDFVTVNGVVFPPEIRKAFLHFIGFYLGQGVK